MDNQLTLHPENLAMFLEPTFKRQTIGHYSITEDKKYAADDSEKASLVALKEVERTSLGEVEYEVPSFVEQLNLSRGNYIKSSL